MIHKLISWKPFFEATIDRKKTHEVRRKQDLTAPIVAGDVIVLEEYDENTFVPTGRKAEVEVTFVSPEPPVGCVVASIRLKKWYHTFLPFIR